MGFWMMTVIFFLAGLVACASVRLCCNRGPSTNLFHLTLIITATICCWMMLHRCEAEFGIIKDIAHVMKEHNSNYLDKQQVGNCLSCSAETSDCANPQ